MDLARALAEVVGRTARAGDPDLKSSYEHDYTGRYGAPARVVVHPADTQQVAAVMGLCARHGAAVVPQGGNTGLVGGGVSREERWWSRCSASTRWRRSTRRSGR
jgi:FAD/FMN-containing dehydrogenase